MVKKDYRWENDSFETPTSPASAKVIVREMYDTFKRQGLKPESIADKDTAEAYGAWLCARPREPEDMPVESDSGS
jgi:hypothetical protein